MTNNNNFKLKKISWFKRLFYSWNKLVNYFENNLKENESQRQKIEELLISDLKSKLADHLDERIKKLQKNDNDFYDLKNKNRNLELEIRELKDKESKFIVDEQHINDLNKQIDKLVNESNEYRNWKALISKNIFRNTEVMNKINNVFFRSTKQIGNFGEKWIEQIFEQSGYEKGKFWTKNLAIGDNFVEFAFRLNENREKWIPIDVKTFSSSEPDENSKIDFDILIKKIESEAKEKISKKYLSQPNTEQIGIMVIPDDDLFLEISRRYVKKIKEIFDKYSVVIASTSIFLQWCHILWFSFDFLDELNNKREFYDDIDKLMTLIKSLINDIIDIKKNFEKLRNEFNLTHDTHYTNIKKQFEKMLNKFGLEKNEKYVPKNDVVKKYKN